MPAERGASARRPTTDGSGGASDSRGEWARSRIGGVVPLLGPLTRGIARTPDEVDEGQLSGGVLRRDTIYRRALGLSDMVAGTLALLFAAAMLGSDALLPGAAGVIVVLVLVAKAAGLYDRDEHLLRKTTLEEAPRVFEVATLCALLTWLADGLVVEGVLGRAQVLGLWAGLLVLLLVGRVAARRLARALAQEERCLIIGDGTGTEWARRKLEVSHVVKATLVGCVPLESSAEAVPGVPHLGRLDSLAALVSEHGIDRVIVAPDASDSDEILDVVRLVKAMGVKVSVLPRLFEVVGSSVEFDDVEGMTLLGVRRYGLTQSSRNLKRGMDLVGALALLVILGPLLLMIAVAIKLGSPGPVLFRQRRVGRNDEEFEMFKFRTMVEDAEERKDELAEHNEVDGGLFKIADDPRITRTGGFLRRTSLDELPQLLNVVRGEMSMVGPRPLVVDEDSQVEGWERHRLHLPPGMTGLWQVFGSSRIPLNEMVKIDYLYGANWSLWSDVKILMRTLPYVLGRRGM
jgi:exopolysaccharide biosynthesis polyprenyl glycosylphosphotransferase